MVRVIRKRSRDHGLWRVRKHRSACADQPLVIEERTTERCMEKVVGERILPRQPIQGHLRQVPGAHNHAGPVAPRRKLVHSATVDLVLLTVVRVDDRGGALARLEVVVEQERAIGQVRREPRVRLAYCLAGLCIAQRGWQASVRLTLLVYLDSSGPGIVNALGARKVAEVIVKAMVLLIQNYDVADSVKSIVTWAAGATPSVTTALASAPRISQPGGLATRRCPRCAKLPGLVDGGVMGALLQAISTG